MHSTGHLLVEELLNLAILSFMLFAKWREAGVDDAQAAKVA